METGAVGGLPRSVDKTSDTVSGSNAEGEARSDTYNCVVGQDLMAAHGLDNDFCHVRVEGCLATTKCYIVGDGNDTPFDTWTVNGCKCNNDDSDAGEMCDESTDGGAGN